MSDNLVKRLRGWARDIQAGSRATWAMDQDLKEAADRIEELSNCVAVLEAKLATCEKYKAAYAECDRIGTQAVRDLEAKLAKAVEALDQIAGKAPYADDPYDIARSALAKLKGDKT